MKTENSPMDMDLELARRSPAAGMAFLTVALLFLFALDLEGTLDIYVKIISLILVAINCHRLLLGQKVIKNKTLAPGQKKFLYLNIYINSTLFSVLFAVTSFHIGFKDWRMVPVMIGFFGLAVGAPFTLSYAKPLLFYFIASWNLPQIGILLYQYFDGQIELRGLIVFSSYFLISIGYCLKQGLDFQKQVYELLKSRQKITEQTAMTEQANRLSALGEMAAGMAHEINTPLAVIQMRADYLLDLTQKSKFEKVLFTEEIKKMTSMVFRISKILQGLRAFSRDSAKDPMQPTDISQIIEESLNLCQEKFRYKSIELRVAKHQSFYLNCIPFQIVQIIVNLLSNSFDAVKDLPHPWVEIRAYKTADHACIDVIDSGSGVPEALVDKIMQPFFTTKEVGRGTGLGLSVSKALIEKHGGDLRYVLVQGASCFRVSIPLKKSENKN